MFLDTKFLVALGEELESKRIGRAKRFLRAHRSQSPYLTVISLADLAARMPDNQTARNFLSHFRIATLKPEIALEAARINRELLRAGKSLGEKDIWIAGFARYYGQPLVSNNRSFDRVSGLRRIGY